MAIKIEYDRICIGNFVLCEDANGVSFDGKVCANEFYDTRVFGGSISGYAAATGINKWPFTADASASDIGELSTPRCRTTGMSSDSFGYTAGGEPASGTIDKFPFVADTSATDVTEQTVASMHNMGMDNADAGWHSGGTDTPSAAEYSTIQKMPYATESNVNSGAGLSASRWGAGGHSDYVNGYGWASGGHKLPGGHTTGNIDKFPFANETPATCVGCLSPIRYYVSSNSSDTHGYTTAGFPPSRNDIHKFPFANGGNSSDVASLTRSTYGAAGSSSTTHGYTAGSVGTDTIDKFPFAADSPASDVGELAINSNYLGAGHQI